MWSMMDHRLAPSTSIRLGEWIHKQSHMSKTHWIEYNWKATLSWTAYFFLEAKFYLQTCVSGGKIHTCLYHDWALFVCLKRLGLTFKFGFKFLLEGSVPVLFISMAKPNNWLTEVPHYFTSYFVSYLEISLLICVCKQKHLLLVWCYSECLSTPGRLEKYAWPRWDQPARCGYTLRVTSHKHLIHLSTLHQHSKYKKHLCLQTKTFVACVMLFWVSIHTGQAWKNMPGHGEISLPGVDIHSE
jgi:hypothetical protein